MRADKQAITISYIKCLASINRNPGTWYPNAFLLIALFLILFWETSLANDVQTGMITGQITDAITKQALPGASIAILGKKLGTYTDGNGEFTIKGIPAGTYSVRISSIGYRPAVFSDIVISQIRPAEINVGLSLAPVELKNTLVVRPGFFAKIEDAINSTQSQSSEEIRRLPGSFSDVVRATANLPGVAQVEAGRNDLIVRGGAPTENLFLIDGIEVSNINHFGTQGSTGGPLSYIDLDFVDRITFNTGGFGVRYGDRLSSVLSVNLRDGRTDRLGGKVDLAATRFGLNLEGPIADRGSFLFSARRSYLDLVFRAAGFEFVPEYWDFLMKTSYRISPRDRVSVLGIAALDNLRLFNDDADDRFENSRRLSNKQNRFVAGVYWQHLISGGSVSTSLGHTLVDFDYRQNDSLLTPIFVSNSVESESFGKVEMLLKVFQNTRLTAGIAGRIMGISGEIFLPEFTTPFGQPLAADQAYDLNATRAAHYVQVAKNWGSLSSTAGMRLDYFGLINTPWSVSPRFSSTFQLSPRLTISGSIGRYHQAPSLVWLATNPFNRSLSFIRSDHYIGGIEFLAREDARIRIEGYFKRYADVPSSIQQPFLVLSNSGAGFGGSEENFTAFGLDSLVSAGHGRVYGVELLVQKKFSESPLYGTLSLTINRTEYAGVDGVYRDGSYDQRLIVNLTSGYVFNEKWEFATKFRLVTGHPYTPFNADGSQNPSSYNTQRLATDHSFDVRVDRRWFFGKWNLITYVDIQNVYNRKSSEVPRYNARIGTTETDDAIGLFPSIGITAEF